MLGERTSERNTGRHQCPGQRGRTGVVLMFKAKEGGMSGEEVRTGRLSRLVGWIVSPDSQEK